MIGSNMAPNALSCAIPMHNTVNVAEESRPSLVTCSHCRQELPTSAFAPCMLAGMRRCRACAKHFRDASRGSKDGTDPKRILHNLRALGRKMGWPEARQWTLRDVELLVAAFRQQHKDQFTHQSRLRLQVIRRDSAKPFLPNNALLRANVRVTLDDVVADGM